MVFTDGSSIGKQSNWTNWIGNLWSSNGSKNNIQRQDSQRSKYVLFDDDEDSNRTQQQQNPMDSNNKLNHFYNYYQNYQSFNHEWPPLNRLEVGTPIPTPSDSNVASQSNNNGHLDSSSETSSQHTEFSLHSLASSVSIPKRPPKTSITPSPFMKHNDSIAVMKKFPPSSTINNNKASLHRSSPLSLFPTENLRKLFGKTTPNLIMNDKKLSDEIFTTTKGQYEQDRMSPGGISRSSISSYSSTCSKTQLNNYEGRSKIHNQWLGVLRPTTGPCCCCGSGSQSIYYYYEPENGGLLRALLFSLTMAAILILVMVMLDPNNQTRHNNGGSIYCEQVCQIQHQYRMSMNESINPCEDFYEFVCERWIREHPIPDHLSSFTKIQMIEEQIQEQLRQLLDELRNKSDKIDKFPLPVRLVIQLYDSCIDIGNKNNKLTLRPLQEYLEKLYEKPYWPLTDEDNNHDEQDYFQEISLEEFSLFGYNSFVDISIQPDTVNSNKRIIQLSPPWFLMDRDDFHLDNSIEAYKKSFWQFGQLLSNRNQSKWQTEFDKMFHLEQQLIEATTPTEQVEITRNHSIYYRRLTLAEFNELTDFDYLTHLNGILGRLRINNRTVWLKPSDSVIIRDVHYFSLVNGILSVTPLRTLINYIGWKAIVYSGQFLTKETQKILFNIHHETTGVTAERPQWQRCLNQVETVFDLALGRLYVDRFMTIDDKLKQSIRNLLHHLKCTFGGRLIGQVKWADSVTKKKARDKLESMHELLGFGEFLTKDEELEKYYGLKQTKIQRNNYYQSYQLVKMDLLRTKFNRLYKPYDPKFEFDISPTAANAIYKRLRNAIVLPAAILQGQFFQKDFPSSINYGSLGFIVGHEITHGFDDIGRQYGQDGHLEDWWSMDTIQNYHRQSQCLVDRYSKIINQNLHRKLNGLNTLTENLADVSGLRAAYFAWRLAKNNSVDDYCHKRNKNRTITDSEIDAEEHSKVGEQWQTHDCHCPSKFQSEEQLFFISFANMWCGHSRPQMQSKQLINGQRLPWKYRVNLPLKNFQPFQTTFKCQRDEQEGKCQIW